MVGVFQVMKLVNPLDLFHCLLKNTKVNKGRLLGLDVGNKYVGLSVSDSCNKIASPLSVLVRKNTNIDLMAGDFKTLVSEVPLTGFVVGLPFGFQGSVSYEAVRVRCFIDELRETRKLEGLSYTYWDENYTSKCVEALLSPLNLHQVESKTILDKFAAVGILQGYLDCMHGEMRKEADMKD